MEAIGKGGREGARVLRTDIRVASLLANDARHQVIARVFGVPPEQQNLLTMVAILALAETAAERLRRMRQGPPLPSANGSLFATASVKELLVSIAGSPARDTPSAGTLLALAVVGGAAAPAALRSIRVVRGASRRMTSGFHHRYGYLVDPGHWRERRARLQAE